MSSLNFPSNPSVGQTYKLGSMTYIWSGNAWLRYNSGNQTFNTVTATNTIVIGTGTTTVAINSNSIYVGGISVLTSSTVLATIKSGTDINVNTSTGYAVISDTSTLQSVTNRGNSTTNAVYISNLTNSTSTTTGALVVNGGVGIGGRVTAESLRIADSVFDSTLVSVNTTATIIIDTYSIAEYRAAKYLIQIDSGSGPTAHFQVIELLLLVDNNQTVFATEYGLLTTNGELGNFAADVQNDNNVRLYFTPSTATTKLISVLRTGMVV